MHARRVALPRSAPARTDTRAEAWALTNSDNSSRRRTNEPAGVNIAPVPWPLDPHFDQIAAQAHLRRVRAASHEAIGLISPQFLAGLIGATRHRAHLALVSPTSTHPAGLQPLSGQQPEPTSNPSRLPGALQTAHRQRMMQHHSGVLRRRLQPSAPRRGLTIASTIKVVRDAGVEPRRPNIRDRQASCTRTTKAVRWVLVTSAITGIDRGNHNRLGGPRLHVPEQSLPLGQRRAARTLQCFGRVDQTTQANDPRASHQSRQAVRCSAATDHGGHTPRDRPGVPRRRLQPHASRQIRDSQGLGHQDRPRGRGRASPTA